MLQSKQSQKRQIMSRRTNEIILQLCNCPSVVDNAKAELVAETNCSKRMVPRHRQIVVCDAELKQRRPMLEAT